MIKKKTPIVDQVTKIAFTSVLELSCDGGGCETYCTSLGTDDEDEAILDAGWISLKYGKSHYVFHSLACLGWWCDDHNL